MDIHFYEESLKDMLRKSLFSAGIRTLVQKGEVI